MSTSLCNHCNFDCKQIVLEVMKMNKRHSESARQLGSIYFKGLVLEFLHIRFAFFVLCKCTGKIVQHRSSDTAIQRVMLQLIKAVITQDSCLT